MPRFETEGNNRRAPNEALVKIIVAIERRRREAEERGDAAKVAELRDWIGFTSQR